MRRVTPDDSLFDTEFDEAVASRQFPTRLRAAIGNGNNQYKQDRPTKGRTVYHGTFNEVLDSILQEGLLSSKAGAVFPDLSRRGHTYVTTDKENGRQWALDKVYTEKVNNDVDLTPVLLTIEVPDFIASKLTPDENFSDAGYLRDDSPDFSSEDVNLQLRGDIRPGWIKVVEVGVEPQYDSSGRRIKSVTWEPHPKLKGAAAKGVMYVILLLENQPDLRTAAEANIDALLDSALEDFEKYLASSLEDQLLEILAAGGAAAERLLAKLRTNIGNGNNQYKQDNPTKDGGSRVRVEGDVDPKKVEEIQQYAEEQGFPANRIVIRDMDRDFTVGGKTFKTAALYNFDSKEITINSIALRSKDLRGLVAHEMSHAMFDDVFGKPGQFREYMKANRTELYSTGHKISRYASAYWKEYQKRPVMPVLKTAIMETLAEVSFLNATNAGSKVLPVWQKFNDALLADYRSREKR
jgi:hypothetical protein